jgi:hypothetical protein
VIFSAVCGTIVRNVLAWFVPLPATGST